MDVIKIITSRLKEIIDEDSDIAVEIDIYLFGMIKLKDGINNYTYEVYGYGDMDTNVQIQLTPDGPFLEVNLYDEPIKRNPITDYDRAMGGISL